VRAYFDSCVVIYRVESPTTLGEPVLKAVAEASADAGFFVSELVRMECLVKPVRLQDVAKERLFNDTIGECTMLDFDREVLALATNLRARHVLKTPDALHVACAIRHGCDEFWTNDNRLHAAGNLIRVRSFP
jgi:predicted nucleic acid-binding protein